VPQIDFTTPTPSNDTYSNINQTYINFSVTDTNNNLDTMLLEWNGTNVTLDSSDLVLNMYLDSYNSSNYTLDSSRYSNYGELKDANASNSDGYTIPSLVDGKFRKALTFDGVDDYVDLGISDSLNITDAITIEAWVKTNSVSVGGYIEANGHSFSQSKGHSIDFTSSKVRFDIGNGTASGSVSSDNTIIDGNWYHVAGTWDGSTVKLYVNGIQQSTTASLAGPIVYTGGNQIIGALYSGGGFFNGTIDEVRIWNRTLSPEEINASYRMSIGQYYANITDLSEGVYWYKGFINDTAGNENSTGLRLFTTDYTQPTINFTEPTPSNNTITKDNFAYINVTTSDTNDRTSFIDWNHSLVGYWGFEQVNASNYTYDNSTYGNDGLLKNFNEENPTTTYGKFGRALEFDGVDDYVEIPKTISLENALLSEGTFEAWVHPNSDWNDASNHWILQAGTNYQNWSIYKDWSGDSISIFIGNLHLKTNTLSWQQDWIFIVCTWSDIGTADSNISLYLDGVFEKNQNGSSYTPSLSSTLFLGSYVGNWASDMTMDEVRIWNRALTPEEINASYNTGLYRLYNNFTNLVDDEYSYYAFTKDAAGNTNRTETRTFTVETVAPTWSNNRTSPISPATYEKNQAYQFNITWVSDTDYVAIEFDGVNYTAANMSGSNAYEYNITLKDLAAGTYTWKAFANDSVGNWNSTDSWSYTIEKAHPILDISNGTYSINSTGLVGYWRLEGYNSSNYTDDFSGYGNDGLLKDGNISNSDGYTIPSLVDGKFRKALTFDGVDDYVDVGNDDSLQLTSAATIEAWVKLDSYKNSTFDNIVGRNKFRIYSDVGSTGYDDITAYAVVNGTGHWPRITYSMPLNEWHHLVVTFDGSLPTNNIKTYFDGTLNVQQNATGTLDIPTDIWYIGGVVGGTINGTIDEVRVWNRALSADEIKLLYESRVTYPTETKFNCTANTSEVVPYLYRNDTNIIPTFTEDFEDDLSQWSIVNSSSTSVIQTTSSIAHSGSKSAEVYQTVDDGDTVLYRSFSPNNVIVEIWVYDNTSVTGNWGWLAGFNFGSCGTGSNYTWGNRTDICNPTYNKRDSGIPRSTGWHLLKYVFMPSGMKALYFDDQLVTLTDEAVTGDMRWEAAWSTTGAGMYWDDIKVYPFNETITLGAGYYYYSCNVSSTANYTRSALLIPLNVSTNTSSIQLALNGTTNNRVYAYPNTVNATGWVIYGDPDATKTLYRNGSSVASGTPASENILLGAGIYNYTYVYSASENYSASSVTRIATVNPGIVGINISLNNSYSDITFAPGGYLLVNATVNQSVMVSIIENGTIVNSSLGGVKYFIQPSVGIYNFSANYSMGGNYT
ncbi:MAG: LamG domain-containing protein, partial [Candidatus Thorarchaeota archaeon]